MRVIREFEVLFFKIMITVKRVAIGEHDINKQFNKPSNPY